MFGDINSYILEVKKHCFNYTCDEFESYCQKILQRKENILEEYQDYKKAYNEVIVAVNNSKWKGKSKDALIEAFNSESSYISTSRLKHSDDAINGLSEVCIQLEDIKVCYQKFNSRVERYFELSANYSNLLTQKNNNPDLDIDADIESAKQAVNSQYLTIKNDEGLIKIKRYNLDIILDKYLAMI